MTDKVSEILEHIDSIFDEELSAEEAKFFKKVLEGPASPIQGFKLPKYEPTKKRNRDVLLMFTLVAVIWACYQHLYLFF